MTSRGKQLAVLVALIILFFLPKRVECGYPDAPEVSCGHYGFLGQYCKYYEVEPIGFWLIETLAHRDVGFAYSSGEACK
ncbi:MAG: hypothetical protein ACKV2T_41570 [Kofleriaceae bacterium]